MPWKILQQFNCFYLYYCLQRSVLLENRDKKQLEILSIFKVCKKKELLRVNSYHSKIPIYIRIFTDIFMGNIPSL